MGDTRIKTSLGINNNIHDEKKREIILVDNLS